MPQGQGHGQGCSADVVNLAGIAHFRVVGIATAAVIPGLALSPDNPPRFLQPAIGKNQLGAHESRSRPAGKGLEQFLQPQTTGLGVVVEQHHVLAAGQAHTAMTGLVKARGLAMAHQPAALHIPGKGLRGAIARAVVHNDHLKGHAGWRIGQGQQAAARHAVVVMGRNDNRDPGLLAGRQGHGNSQRTAGRRICPRFRQQLVQPGQLWGQGSPGGHSPMQPSRQASMLLPDQGIELVWEGRLSMLQQGRPGGQLKWGQLKAGIEADPPTIEKLEMVGAAITNLGGKGQMEAALAIALQPLPQRAVDQQRQLLSGRSPAVNPGPFKGMEATGRPTNPGHTLAPQGLELAIALGIKPLGATTEFHLPIGGQHKGPQHAARTPHRQGQGQGPLHEETALG